MKFNPIYWAVRGTAVELYISGPKCVLMNLY